VEKVPCEAEFTPVIAGGVYVQVYGSDLLGLTQVLFFVVLVDVDHPGFNRGRTGWLSTK